VCGRAAGNTLRTQKQTESKSVNAEIVQTPSWRYKTIVVIKRQQQTAISNFSIRALQLYITVCDVCRCLLRIKYSAFCTRCSWVLKLCQGKTQQCFTSDEDEISLVEDWPFTCGSLWH